MIRERLEFDGYAGSTWVLAWVEDGELNPREIAASVVPAQFLDARTRRALQVAWEFEDPTDEETA